MSTTTIETAEHTLARLTRKLRHWEHNLTQNELYYMAEEIKPADALARVRAQLSIVHHALEEIGEKPADV
jgi:hypothetical protein